MTDPNMMQLLRENQRLLQENNTLLRKMRRGAVLAFWLRLLWLAILLGAPVALYVYFLKPYIDALPEISSLEATVSQYEEIQQLLQQLPTR